MIEELKKKAEKNFNLYCLSELIYYQSKLSGSDTPLQDLRDALEIVIDRLTKEGKIQ